MASAISLTSEGMRVQNSVSNSTISGDTSVSGTVGEIKSFAIKSTSYWDSSEGSTEYRSYTLRFSGTWVLIRADLGYGGPSNFYGGLSSFTNYSVSGTSQTTNATFIRVV